MADETDAERHRKAAARMYGDIPNDQITHIRAAMREQGMNTAGIDAEIARRAKETKTNG